MIAPLIDEIAADNNGKLKCLKLNTDESPGVATEYGIRSIPTVMVFKGRCTAVRPCEFAGCEGLSSCSQFAHLSATGSCSTDVKA